MDERGELVTSLGDLVRPAAPTTITMTDEAAAIFREAAKDAGPGESLRLAVDARFGHDLFIGPKRDGDVEVEANGIVLVLDRGSARRADGVSIAYVDGPQGGFKIDNPNAPPSVKLLSPTEAKALVEREPTLRFIDVRTPGERERAAIQGTTLLDPKSMAELTKLPKDTPLLFHCHHGQRSQQAAMHFLELGFRTVYNVVGGIEAWSQEVDPSIPRY
jgi:monothiol glutaredoxin